MIKGQDLKFGIEIECYIPTSVRIAVGQYHRGRQVAQLPRGWKAEADGSLTSYHYGYKAVEFVSPPLQGEEGLRQVVEVADWLVSIGAITDDTCGLHIHVDGTNLVRDDITNLVAQFKEAEKVFFYLNGQEYSNRLNNYYCKNSENWDGYGFTDRYQSLNLTNLGEYTKRTVEFRLFSSTLEAETLMTAIFMCIGIVSKATETSTVTRIKNTANSIEKFVDAIMSKPEYQPTAYDDDDIGDTLKDKTQEAVGLALA